VRYRAGAATETRASTASVSGPSVTPALSLNAASSSSSNSGDSSGPSRRSGPSGRLGTRDAERTIVVRRPTDGREVGPRPDDKALRGRDLTTENVADVAGAQDGERVVRALPATVFSQDSVRGATTTGGRATVTVRDRP